MAAGMPPVQLVEILSEIFSAFDELAERHKLEKIKTIGDAYMLAGGLPEKHDGHVLAVATMGLDMLKWIEGYRERSGLRIGLRVGIHTGPVVAGVIGSKKFIYDLWGDTVNLASRMESNGVAGRVQISGEVFEALAGALPTEPRGAIAIKGRGEMETYLLTQPVARQPVAVGGPT
jgi:class 3 adenylate cyclase